MTKYKITIEPLARSWYNIYAYYGSSFIMKKQYMYYTKKQALSMFKKELNK